MLSGLVFVGRTPYVRLLEQQLISSLAEQNLHLEFEGFDGFLVGARADSASLFRAGVPFTVAVKDLNVSLSVPALLKLHPRLRLNGELYGGSVHGNVSQELLSGRSEGFFIAESVQIGAIPEMQLVGIEGGSLSLGLRDLHFTDGVLSKGKANIVLKGLNKPDESVLPPALTGLPLPVVLPPLEGDLSIQAMRDANGIQIQTFQLDTSLGKVSGAGRCDSSPVPLCSLTFDIDLTPKGKEDIGAFFALIPQTGGGVSDSSFRISIEGPISAPAVRRMPQPD